MVHRNAPLTEAGRLRLARCIVEHGWPIARAAERFQVARPTAKKWTDRYRDHGPAGMTDRSSRPHSSPRRTPQPVVRQVVHLRQKQRLGPVASQPGSGWPLHGAPDPGRLPDQPAAARRPGHRRNRSAASRPPGPANWCTSL